VGFEVQGLYRTVGATSGSADEESALAGVVANRGTQRGAQQQGLGECVVSPAGSEEVALRRSEGVERARDQCVQTQRGG
jgi:hypothetical protein